jgi:hypothetical protein
MKAAVNRDIDGDISTKIRWLAILAFLVVLGFSHSEYFGLSAFVGFAFWGSSNRFQRSCGYLGFFGFIPLVALGARVVGLMHHS